MSTFCGQFEEEEFRCIAIDKFDINLLNCNAFFLSHFHHDHMKGLFNYHFMKYLKKEGCFLYCSEITKKLLNRELILPDDKIKLLEKNGTMIESEAGQYIRVTPLSAGHCPGSLMFMFEGYNKRILYTGDFRFDSSSDLKKIKRLHDNDGNVLQFDSLYVDTTFASQDYYNFPTRKESLNLIIGEIKKWFKGKGVRKVRIKQPANIGTEYLIVELYKTFNIPIHVSERAAENFISCVDNLMDIVTLDDAQDKIHFCLCSCPEIHKHNTDNARTLIIRPKALSFKQNSLEEDPIKYMRLDTIDVLYSSHSSLKELIMFIDYLKPLAWYPSVVGKGLSKEGIVKLVENMRKMSRTCKVNEEESLTCYSSTGNLEKLQQQEKLEKLTSKNAADIYKNLGLFD